MFYVIGLNCVLHGGEEHRSLRHGARPQLSLMQLEGYFDIRRTGRNIIREVCRITTSHANLWMPMRIWLIQRGVVLPSTDLI